MKAVLLLFLMLPFSGIAQEAARELDEEGKQLSKCVLNLQKAERLYQQGKVEDIPDLLRGCIKKGFNRDERMTAYKLLILTDIYDDDLEQADMKMYEFLKKYPEYEISPADQDEFAQLFNSYETRANWSVSIKGGMLFSFPVQTEPYGVMQLKTSPYEYSSGMGFNVGAGIMKYLSPSMKLNLEVQFLSHEFNYKATPDFFTSFAEIDYTERTQQLAVPLSLNNDFGSGNLKPFLRLGVMPVYMLSSTKNIGRTYTNKAFDELPRSTEDMLEYRNTFSAYLLTGGGLKYKIPYAGKIVLDIRFNMGLMEFVDPAQRYANSSQVWRYYVVDGKYRLNFLDISLGWIYPFYKSKKKQPLSY